ncbi:MAG: formylglycine-generating enzyme family protein [Candidatus Aminicenantes bacterium]|nr:formylglycine-generating enzyme family protein [Candidatus Aminicenantes bacterium]
MNKSLLKIFFVCFVCLIIFFLLYGNEEQIEGFVLVKGGTFQMGDLFDEGNALEKPVHQVQLGDFYLAEYEVTVKNFRTFVNETGYKTSAEGEHDEEAQKKIFDNLAELMKSAEKNMADFNHTMKKALSYSGSYCIRNSGNSWTFEADMNWRNPIYAQTEMNPVTCISWNDAVHYCNWLSRKEGLPVAYDEETGDLLDEYGRVTSDVTKVKGYRLPTEAEWEYAAREGGNKVRFGNGKNMARSEDINFDASEAKYPYAKKGEFRGRLVPVGSFAPNKLGLYDMSGNVWEWCSDCVTMYKNEHQVDPYIIGAFHGVKRRVARGGRWAGDANELRVSARFGWESYNRCNNIGFRVARSK